MTDRMIEVLEGRTLFTASPFVPMLTAADVTTILGQAGSQAKNTQAIVVVDRDGNVLGEYDGSQLAGSAYPSEEVAEIRLDAALRARTAAYFESAGEAFTTRTARFIIQDHFPTQVFNTPGGPLYGVEFSSAAASDLIPVDTNPNSPYAAAGLLGPAGLSGDPGGIPLYKMGINSAGLPQEMPVGAIGVAGDFSDTLARKDLALPSSFLYSAAANPKGRVFNGTEQTDFDESVALAGAGHYMAPVNIRANQIFVNGLRLPFTASVPASRKPKLSLDALVSTADGIVKIQPTDAVLPNVPVATFSGITGTLVRRNTRANPTQTDQNYSIVASNDTDPMTGQPLPSNDLLTVSDVTQIITQAVATAAQTRGGIRRPIGVHADVFVSVVDRDGDLLGSFRMGDATNFSYDVSVQKARTATYFSDNSDAFSTRAIGYMSQRFFPPGIDDAVGPMYELQNGLKFADLNSSGQIVDDTLNPVGTVTAAVSDPGSMTIPVAASGAGLDVGQIVTFGDDTAHEYLITSDTSAGITVQQDGIDPGPSPLPALTAGEAILPKNLLKNGITIFPGGFPLYKNGQLVGAIGISGDGVDQDDLIGYSGTSGFRPSTSIESDDLSKSQIVSFIGSKLQELTQAYQLGSVFTDGTTYADFVQDAEKRLKAGLSQQELPYVKFPRNPYV